MKMQNLASPVHSNVAGCHFQTPGLVAIVVQLCSVILKTNNNKKLSVYLKGVKLPISLLEDDLEGRRELGALRFLCYSFLTWPVMGRGLGICRTQACRKTHCDFCLHREGPQLLCKRSGVLQCASSTEDMLQESPAPNPIRTPGLPCPWMQEPECPWVSGVGALCVRVPSLLSVVVGVIAGCDFESLCGKTGENLPAHFVSQDA